MNKKIINANDLLEEYEVNDVNNNVKKNNFKENEENTFNEIEILKEEFLKLFILTLKIEILWSQ